MSRPADASTGPLASFTLAGNTIVAAALGSIYLIGGARLLGPREFSDLSVCLSLLSVGLLFLGPLNLTLIRFSSAYRLHNDEAQIRPLLRKAGRLYAPWIAGAIAAAMIFATPIATTLHIRSASLVPWTGVLIGLGIALGAIRAIALGAHQHRLYSNSVLFDVVVRAAAGGVLIWLYRTAGSALAGFVAGSGAALVIFGALALKRLPVTERPWTESNEALGFMARALAFSAVVAGLHNVDMIAVKMRLDADGAGDYAVALAVARGFILLAAPFAAVALARPTSEGLTLFDRITHAPLAAFSVIAVPAVAVLWAAPGFVLTMLYGRDSEAQIHLLPVLAMAYALGGAFLILAHGEIRSGRIGFLVPTAVTLAAEIGILLFISSTATMVGWIVLAAHAATVGCVVATPWIYTRLLRFEGSAKYWDDRYARGGDSGGGSVGKFGAFKAEILNGFVGRHHVQTVIEFGCGDGRQLSLAEYPSYLGVDVSPEAVTLCRDRFRDDPSKTFTTIDDYSGQQAELTLSLDVIYHLVEDEVFDRYMQRLFDASRRWVIVYASNRDETDRSEAIHVRHHHFTRWVEANRPAWILRETIPNRYPYTGDYRLGSFSDFYIFERA